MTELELILRTKYSDEDVRQIMKLYPEPSIPSPENEVEYDDPTHTYHYAGVVYRSATKIVSQFHEHFDTTTKSEWMAHRWGRSPEYWRDQWKDTNEVSLIRGNDIHDKQEQFLYNRGFTSVTGPRIYPVYKRDHSKKQKNGIYRIQSLADGCYPELKLWNHDWCIAGRSDKPTIETISGHRYVHIEDYKTNKKLQQNGFVDKYGNERMMLEPLSHLPDCEMIHYTLQLSLYQYMFEYFGFLPGIRRIIHFPHEIEDLGIPSPKAYELPYLRHEIISMLETLNLRGWLNNHN